MGGLQPASAIVGLNADGTFNVTVGAADITGVNTTLPGRSPPRCWTCRRRRSRVTYGDTKTAPFAGMSAGSKTTYTVGRAVKLAAEDARRQMIEIAAPRLEATAGRVRGGGRRGAREGRAGQVDHLRAPGQAGRRTSARATPQSSAAARSRRRKIGARLHRAGRRRRSRPGHRRDHGARLRGRAGRRLRDQPALGRRPDAGRRQPGARHRALGRDDLRRRRASC